MISSLIRQSRFRVFKVAEGKTETFTIEADEAYLHVRNDCTLLINRSRELEMAKAIVAAQVDSLEKEGTNNFPLVIRYGAGPIDLKSLPGFGARFQDNMTPSKLIGITPITYGVGIKETVSVLVDIIESDPLALFLIEEVHYVPADSIAA